ncbi:glycerol-3-phosphate 1-O-acyltransferase PlsY [Candidatus Aerophobetes bacterium]|nr:glycerol-3-phosphate 1-O-acyltransferase PlsY [Candidatus Aerophobetes bacterium]
MFITPVAVIITGYLLGSIPGGYIIGKGIRKVDVRNYGSGNIGTTNVLRVLGKKAALFVFLIDVGKGVASVWISGLFPSHIDLSIIRAIGGFSCIIGHNWPVFLKFRGGKGVATSAGVFLLLTPLPFLFSLLTMVITVGVTRYVSVGSMVSAALLPFYIWILMGKGAFNYTILGIVVAVIIVLRHHSNLKRLFSGREHKLGEKVQEV